MVLPLTYRRPSHQSNRAASVSGEEKAASISGSVDTCFANGIPPALSFDRIIAGGVCPPCTLRDFLNYLKYIEHSAENLQFFLWYRSYVERFEHLPQNEKALSPEWVASPDNEQPQLRRQKVSPHVAEALKGTDFESKATKTTISEKDPFHSESSRNPSPERERELSSEYGSSWGESKTLTEGSNGSSYVTKADEAFDDAGLQWKPFTAQPFRQEVNRIVAIYLASDAPRQLNLSDRERSHVLHALQNTTHPSAFRVAVTDVEYSLRKQAHPNFIRWTICNGNRARVIFARGLGISGIVVGLVADILITLSSAGRGWRVLPIIGYLIGISTLIAAWKGMCVVLHGMHHRHLRPWELFEDEDSNSIEARDMSQDSLVSNTSNSYEDEPWVARYEKRNVVRKVFDREVWITEPALRQIQDTIFVQSLLGALIVSVVLTAIFCAVPHGNFF